MYSGSRGVAPTDSKFCSQYCARNARRSIAASSSDHSRTGEDSLFIERARRLFNSALVFRRVRWRDKMRDAGSSFARRHMRSTRRFSNWSASIFNSENLKSKKMFTKNLKHLTNFENYRGFITENTLQIQHF